MAPNEITDYIEAALKATTLRSKVIAANIANAETPGYKRHAVDFEKALASAMEDGSSGLDEVEPEIFQPLNTKADATGNDVSMEMEVGEMVRNSARYKTYMRLLNKTYRQMEAAIGGPGGI